MGGWGRKRRSGEVAPASQPPTSVTVNTSIEEAQALLVVAEYSALRAEIGRYQDHQRQLINSVFVVLGAVFTLATRSTSLIEKPGLIQAQSLLLFSPPVFTFLAFLYADRALRIVRLAHYLHSVVRPVAESVSKIQMWEWEAYKRTTTVVPRKAAYFLDKFRWSVFLAPSVAMTLIGLWQSNPDQPTSRVVGIIVGALSVVGIVVAAMLTEETSGVVTDDD